jgi:hypothetical protein
MMYAWVAFKILLNLSWNSLPKGTLAMGFTVPLFLKRIPMAVAPLMADFASPHLRAPSVRFYILIRSLSHNLLHLVDPLAHGLSKTFNFIGCCAARLQTCAQLSIGYSSDVSQ